MNNEDLPPKTAPERRDYVVNRVLPELDLRPYINGSFVDSQDLEIIRVTDPTTELLLAEVPGVGSADIQAAVEVAGRTFESGAWSGIHPRERAACLYRLAALVEANVEVLALLEACDVGKRIAGTRSWDIPNAAEVYRYYAGWADKLTGDVLPNLGGVSISTRRDPVGVCVAILAWNFPFACLAWKLAPALAAGCTIIVKLAERAPLTGIYLANMISEAGFPNGVVNIVTGGSLVGSTLVADERVDLVSFTGGSATGEAIQRASANHVPRLILELGGKSPNIIHSDADLDAAIAGSVGAMFTVSGQDCGAGSRTFVHSSVVDKYLVGLKESIQTRLVGDPLDDDTEQGPLIDREHYERVDRFVQDALGDGAHVLGEGGPSPLGGLFYLPTVLTNIQHENRIAQTEIFGPVGCVFSYDDVEDAFRLANSTRYGLAGAIWTQDRKLQERFKVLSRSGTVWINCYGYFDTVAPWGGTRQSGHGRELGIDGIQGYLTPKAIFDASGA